MYLNVAYAFYYEQITNGILLLLIILLIEVPIYFTNRKIKKFPTSIEVSLLLIIYIGYVMGEIYGLYYKWTYFDKFVHFLLPALIASIGFLVGHALFKSGGFKTNKMLLSFFVLLITLGIGALWEIIEFILDILRIHYFTNWVVWQGGSSKDTPFGDTMKDLIFDTIGGIIGAFITYYNLKKQIITESEIEEIKKDIIEKF